MAGLASGDRTVGSRLLHALLKLPFVRISVAAGATQILPAINNRGLRLEVRRLLVTFGARGCDVPAGQHEVRLLVLDQGERGRLVSLKIMAAFAGVEVGCRGKLPRMTVDVTIGAALKLEPEQCVLSFRDMTLCTVCPCVLPLQRIRARRMLLDRVCRRLPTVHRMARNALSAVRPLSELAIVRIGLVAIHALLECPRLLEISVGVALGTIDTGMFPFQRKLGFGVVEAFVDRLERNLLPSTCAVTGLAALREAPPMRVLVAVGALVERNAHILRLAVRSVRVALGALHLGMQAGQRITCLRVIEL